jgi:phosphodiesterase/alkaline phosphatase D-like protein
VSSALVEYGPTTSYGATANVSPAPGSGTSAVAVSAILSGLQPLQTYHFRISATNQSGTSTGQDGTFTTGAAAPVVTTGASSNVSATGATLSGTVNPNGQSTTATFEFGLTTSYGSIANGAPNPGSGTAPVNVTALLSGLTPNRTYHYRLTATNAGGFTAGADATFNTSASLPTVLTQAATAVTTTGATLHG